MARRNGGFVGQDGLDAPDPPTGITPTAGSASVSVAFTAPSDAGTSAITGFVAQVSTDDVNYSGGSNTGTSSPIVVSSLTNGTNYTAKVWAINAYGTSAPSDASAAAAPVAPPRGLFTSVGSAASSVFSNVIEYITITTTGNSTDFGDMTIAKNTGSSFSSSTRGVFNGGKISGSITDTIDYVTIATTGNATDFGNLSTSSHKGGSFSNNVRGVMSLGAAGGPEAESRVNILEYVTIANTGNSTDFGDLTLARSHTSSTFASPTRGVVAGGYGAPASPYHVDIIDYVTIGSTGNATDFGNMSTTNYAIAGASSNTRGIIAGHLGNSLTDRIEYVTIANTGNATDFGNLTATNFNNAGCSSNIRACFAGGSAPNKKNIDYVTIATTGNAADFGDLSAVTSQFSGCSSDHGGLQ